MSSPVSPEQAQAPGFPEPLLDAFLRANWYLPQTNEGIRLLCGSVAVQTVLNHELSWSELQQAKLTEEQIDKVAVDTAKAHRLFNSRCSLDGEAPKGERTYSRDRLASIASDWNLKAHDLIEDYVLLALPEENIKAPFLDNPEGATFRPEALVLGELWSVAVDIAFTTKVGQDIARLHREALRTGRPNGQLILELYPHLRSGLRERFPEICETTGVPHLSEKSEKIVDYFVGAIYE